MFRDAAVNKPHRCMWNPLVLPSVTHPSSRQYNDCIDCVNGCLQDGERKPLWRSVVQLLAVTAVTAFFSEFLVSSIDGMCQELNISKVFVGVVLLPLVGNATEHLVSPAVGFYASEPTITSLNLPLLVCRLPSRWQQGTVWSLLWVSPLGAPRRYVRRVPSATH